MLFLFHAAREKKATQTKAEELYIKNIDVKNKIDKLIREAKEDLDLYTRKRNERAILICNAYLKLLEKMKKGEEIKDFGIAEIYERLKETEKRKAISQHEMKKVRF